MKSAPVFVYTHTHMYYNRFRADDWSLLGIAFVAGIGQGEYFYYLYIVWQISALTLHSTFSNGVFQAKLSHSMMSIKGD